MSTFQTIDPLELLSDLMDKAPQYKINNVKSITLPDQDSDEMVIEFTGELPGPEVIKTQLSGICEILYLTIESISYNLPDKTATLTFI